MSNIKETVSFGGLGDAYIVLLKLVERVRKHGWAVRHLHVEGNSVVPLLVKDLQYMIPMDVMPRYDAVGNLVRGIESFDGVCDKKYQKNFKKGKYKDKIILNTTWHGKYDFPGEDDGLENSFVQDHNNFFKHYDVCIQVSAGAKADRDWNFNPFQLKKILENKGKKVVLVGKDERFEDENDSLNFVGSDLFVNCGIILTSNIFVGLSGFPAFLSLSHKMPVIYNVLSQQHEKHYIHPDWKKYKQDVKLGSLQEVLQCLEKTK